VRAGRLLAALASPPMFVLLCVVSIPLILLRLFGVLFFAATTSGWAVVPAIALGALLGASHLPLPVRRVIALVALVLYGCSLYFHGWGNIADRLAEGGDPFLDGLEASLLALLALRCVMQDRPSAVRVVGGETKT